MMVMGWLYRWLVFPLALFLGRFGLFPDKKVKETFRMRQKKEGKFPWLNFPENTRPIWIHAASGEFEYVKPVLFELKKAYPEQKVLVTYFSPSYKSQVENHPAVDMSCPLPWDHTKYLKPFIKHHNPKALLFARTDVWPETLQQAKKHGIPTLLFSATLTETSKRMASPLSRGVAKWSLKDLDAIFCVTEEDKELFSKMGLEDLCEVQGDTRFDQVIHRMMSPKPLRREVTPSRHDTCFIAGSTWSEDEKVLIPSLPLLMEKSVRPVLVPHEPTPKHVAQLQKDLEKLGIKSAIYSQAPAWNPDEALIVDQMGVLAEIYSWGKFAFVGGAFKASVHSVMEPLAAGCQTYFGPHHKNNREAMEFKELRISDEVKTSAKNLFFAKEVKNSEELVEGITNALEHPQFSILKARIQKAIVKRSGNSSRVVRWIESVTKLG